MGKPQVRLPVRLPPTAMIKNFAPAILNASQSTGLGSGTDRLDSWKEIASYLRREVRTVQLWEKKEGLPVHRHFHKRLGSVYALRSEIDSWKRQVSRQDAVLKTQSPPPSRASREAGDRITIYVLPLKNVTVSSERRRLCDAIAGKTIAALERVNPAQLGIVSAKPSTTRPEPGDPPARIPGDEKVDFLLQWSIQDGGSGLRVDVALLFAGND